MYPGRASASPSLDLFMTLLHWGAEGGPPRRRQCTSTLVYTAAAGRASVAVMPRVVARESCGMPLQGGWACCGGERRCTRCCCRGFKILLSAMVRLHHGFPLDRELWFYALQQLLHVNRCHQSSLQSCLKQTPSCGTICRRACFGDAQQPDLHRRHPAATISVLRFSRQRALVPGVYAVQQVHDARAADMLSANALRSALLLQDVILTSCAASAGQCQAQGWWLPASSSRWRGMILRTMAHTSTGARDLHDSKCTSPHSSDLTVDAFHALHVPAGIRCRISQQQRLWCAPRPWLFPCPQLIG